MLSNLNIQNSNSKSSQIDSYNTFIKQVNIKEVQENIKDRDFILSYFRKVDNAHNAINYTTKIPHEFM